MRIRLFWKLGLTYLALLLAVLLAVDFYAARVLRRDNLHAAQEQLVGLSQLIRSRPPTSGDENELRSWVAWMASSGARVTVIGADGWVLADSTQDAETAVNHASNPEFQQALTQGEGESVRHSDTLDWDLVYHAIRYQPSGATPAVIRLALPLAQIDSARGEIRRRLFVISLVLLILGGTESLLFSRNFSERVGRLERFARRVADGDFRPLEPDSQGDELSHLGQALNETTARLDQTVRSLTDERNRSRAILSSMVEGVAVVDRAENVLFFNEAFSRNLGIDAGRQGQRLVEITRHSKLIELVREVLAGHETVHGEIAIGTVRPSSFAITAAPVIAADSGANSSAASGALLVLHDISELRRLERVRQDFIANVSHEFKTPLTTIQGFAETLLSGALDDLENRQRFVEIIRDNGRRLARLTDDLLKLSRIEAGKLELKLQPVATSELIERSVETMRPRAEQKHLDLRTECSPDLPATRADPERLGEVLGNLLDNALRYTPAGGRVTVRAQATDRAVMVTVSDTGIGVPASDQQRIFERFYRVDASRSREDGGTGLGLAIAKHIVEAHGGQIWVESQVQQGSDFHFTIPLAS